MAGSRKVKGERVWLAPAFAEGRSGSCLVHAVGAPAFDCQFNFVPLEAFAQRVLQGLLQLLAQRRRAAADMLVAERQYAVQEAGVAAAVQAEHLGAARALEMSVLVLGMMARIAMCAAIAMLGAGAVAEHAVIAGNLVGQAGVGQAVERAVQGDPVHVDELILHVLMRKGATRFQQGGQDLDAGRRNAQGDLAQLCFGQGGSLLMGARLGGGCGRIAGYGFGFLPWIHGVRPDK